MVQRFPLSDRFLQKTTYKGLSQNEMRRPLILAKGVTVSKVLPLWDSCLLYGVCYRKDPFFDLFVNNMRPSRYRLYRKRVFSRTLRYNRTDFVSYMNSYGQVTIQPALICIVSEISGEVYDTFGVNLYRKRLVFEGLRYTTCY